MTNTPTSSSEPQKPAASASNPQQTQGTPQNQGKPQQQQTQGSPQPSTDKPAGQPQQK
jgi:hypothetical protein